MSLYIASFIVLIFPVTFAWICFSHKHWLRSNSSRCSPRVALILHFVRGGAR